MYVLLWLPIMDFLIKKSVFQIAYDTVNLFDRILERKLKSLYS